MGVESFDGIVGTGGVVSATGGHERRQEELIESDQGYGNPFEHQGRTPGILLRSSGSSALAAVMKGSPTGCRQRIITCFPVSAGKELVLICSFNARRVRFRTVALPSLLGTKTAKLLSGGGQGRCMMVRVRPFILRPSRNIRSMRVLPLSRPSLAGVSDGESFSAFSSAGIEYLAATFGRHSGAKTVGAFSFDVVRSVRGLHSFFFPVLCGVRTLSGCPAVIMVAALAKRQAE